MSRIIQEGFGDASLLTDRREINELSLLLKVVNGFSCALPGLLTLLCCERNASLAIHGSFERLQFIDLSLGNPLAPRQTQSCKHGVIVLLDPSHEAPQFRDATSGCLLHPGRQLVMVAFAHHHEKGLEQAVDDLDLW